MMANQKPRRPTDRKRVRLQVMREVTKNMDREKMIYLHSVCLLWNDVCFYKCLSDQEINLDSIFLPNIKTLHPRLLLISSICAKTQYIFLKWLSSTASVKFVLSVAQHGDFQCDYFQSPTAYSAQTWTNTDNDRLSKLSRGKTGSALTHGKLIIQSS